MTFDDKYRSFRGRTMEPRRAAVVAAAPVAIVTALAAVVACGTLPAVVCGRGVAVLGVDADGARLVAVPGRPRGCCGIVWGVTLPPPRHIALATAGNAAAAGWPWVDDVRVEQLDARRVWASVDADGGNGPGVAADAPATDPRGLSGAALECAATTASKSSRRRRDDVEIASLPAMFHTWLYFSMIADALWKGQPDNEGVRSPCRHHCQRRRDAM